jgi:hypothetical protein
VNVDLHELVQLLQTLLHDEVPSTAEEEDRALFDLRSSTDELGEVVEVVDEPESRGAGTPDRTITFAGESQVVAVAISWSERVAVGRIDPERAAAVTVISVGGLAAKGTADERGLFVVPVPAGHFRLVIAPATAGPTLRTEWLTFAAADDIPGSVADGRVDELVQHRLAARAATAVTRYRRGPVDATLDVALPVEHLEPPTIAVSRTLAPAAQRGARPLPSHRWTNDDERLSVVLEEFPDDRITLTVAGTVDIADDLVVSVGWTTTSVDGWTGAGRLVTPLPAERTEQRVSTYDVGSARELRAFGIGAVHLFSARTVTASMVESALSHRPYGNAVRAWEELVVRLQNADLRRAFERSLGGS